MFRRVGIGAQVAAAIVFVVIVCHSGRAVAQSTPSLTVGGEVHTPLALTVAELAAMPRASAVVTDDRDAQATYDGVPVAEILKRAGAPPGEGIARADQVILVADHRDGKALDSRAGPLRIVVPSDKGHARWVRGVVSLTLKSAR